MTITRKDLEDKKACKHHYDNFVLLFGDKVEVTEELCIKHYRDFGLAWNWIAKSFLSNDKFIQYEEELKPMRMAYGKQTVPILSDEYELAKAKSFYKLSKE